MLSNLGSGATLPVIDAAQSCIFTIDSQNVAIISDPAIINPQCDPTSSSIQFQAQLINCTSGYCDVSIPKALMQSPFTVTSACNR